MPNTILEAIKMGLWDFEPKELDCEDFEACGAMPGTPAKLMALAERVRLGLPLWHPADRSDCEDAMEEDAAPDGWQRAPRGGATAASSHREPLRLR